MKFISGLKLAVAAMLVASLAACGGGEEDFSSSSSSGSSSTSSTSLASCGSLSYSGDRSDIQVYSLDAAAMLRSCQYKATGDASYLDIGNQTCRSLRSYLDSVDSTFSPQYCTGSRLRV